MNKLNIYKASAGSGKTHTLTEEFLNLAILYPDNFRRILAVTFTNKAAEEMKMRILEALNDMVNKGSSANFYSVFQDAFPKSNEAGLLKKARVVRDNILHNYSFFSINTIDSFVQKVIRAFTFEIGVQSGYRIELDTDKVVNELTELLSKAIDSNKYLKDWLIRFAHYKIDDGKNWDFRAEIKELAKEIFKEQFQALETDNKNNKDEDFIKILDYYDELLKIKNSFESEMKKFSKQAEKIMEQHSVKEANLGRTFSTIRNYLLKTLKEESNDKYELKVTVLKIIDNEEFWSAKTANASIKDTVSTVFPELNSIIKQVLQKIETDMPAYLSANNILSNFHAFGILTNLAELLPEYREENNLLLISDTTRILKELIGGNDAPFIYEKIGNKYRHLLIDEFQDTSGFQWANFKPLIQNSLAENNANLIVGDIKQSIYRWRGGDWRLLLNQVEHEIGKGYIATKTLDTNWRSKKNIVDFNNFVFHHAAKVSQQIFNTKLEVLSNNELESFGNNIKDVITSSYSDTYQHMPKGKENSGGRVAIEFIEKEGRSKKDYREKVLEKLPETIEDLLSNGKYNAGDLAILVRTNRDGKEVAEALLDFMSSGKASVQYPILSSESLFLINSFAIRIIINALYYIHNPQDRLHLMALTAELIKSDSGKGFQHNDFRKEKPNNNTEIIPERFFADINKLKKQNLFEICESLIDVFDLKTRSNQIPYIQSFQELLKEFITGEIVDLEHFLKWWDEKGKNKSVMLSEQDDSLKIMTIHKSKGLAFGVVIIPFFDWDLEKQALVKSIIWAKPQTEPFNKFEIVPLVYRKSLSKSTFKKEYYEETLYTYMDAMNMMYVAFTRPKRELLIFAPYEPKPKEIKTVSELLQKLVSDKVFDTDDEKYISIPDFYDATENIFELKADKEKEMTENENDDSAQVFELDEYPVTDWTQKLNILHHAEDFFIKSIEYIEEKVNYGSLMHEIFAKIKTPKDIDEAVNSQYYDGKISSKELQFLKDKILSIIKEDKVTDWFSDKWTVKNEDAILDNKGNLKIPDRVLISKNKTIVIDFKFGEAHKEHHEQVAGYMQLLKEMDYPNIEGYLYYAEHNNIEEVMM
jgi:ATP-dependent exoDNAse (exonuclease V) beta subunit